MVIRFQDPTDEVANRVRAIQTRDLMADPQEARERQDAARAYAREQEQHFVDYCYDCIKSSASSRKYIRQVQEQCYSVYLENEPASYQDKEEWQSRVVVPKPFSTVQYGTAAVKKAFTPRFLGIQDAEDKNASQFWHRVMEKQIGPEKADFVMQFAASTNMALAIGEGLEMIPRFIPQSGIEFSLVEPWKIARDPDAKPRDPQSGMYWVHTEWLDWWLLKQAEKSGRYKNVNAVKDSASTENIDAKDPLMTKERVEQRRQMHWERSGFRRMVQVSEFWGTVLSPKGELLMPRARYTVAAGRVIEPPRVSPYASLRWPGITWSPLPDLLRHGGRGLLEGILKLWDAMNQILCLHIDNLQWVVNPMTEINVDRLVDKADVLTAPGKDFLVRETANGQQAVRQIDRKVRTSDILANLQYFDQNYQRGSFVTDSVQGLPGWRQDITFREAAMNLDQALGVYGLMGEYIERGATGALNAAREVVETHATLQDYERLLGKDAVAQYGLRPNPEARNGVEGLPPMSGRFHVSGIQALMRDNETMQNIQKIIVPLSGHPKFEKYINAYKVLKAVEQRTNLEDEGVIADEQEAQVIDFQERLSRAKQSEAAEAMADLQELLGIADLVERIQRIEGQAAGDMTRIAQGVIEEKEQEMKKAETEPQANG